MTLIAMLGQTSSAWHSSCTYRHRPQQFAEWKHAQANKLCEARPPMIHQVGSLQPSQVFQPYRTSQRLQTKLPHISPSPRTPTSQPHALPDVQHYCIKQRSPFHSNYLHTSAAAGVFKDLQPPLIRRHRRIAARDQLRPDRRASLFRPDVLQWETSICHNISLPVKVRELNGLGGWW